MGPAALITDKVVRPASTRVLGRLRATGPPASRPRA